MNTLKGGKSIPPLSLFIAHGNGLWVAQDGMGVSMGKESLKHGQIVGQFIEGWKVYGYGSNGSDKVYG